ncbi:RfaG Glycosyltransferase [Candidatus Methylopumilus planktonicus]
MILGIDASSIRSGGGVTHLVELLRAATPSDYGFKKVIVWGGRATLAKIEDRDWLLKVNDPLLDRGLFYRVFWQCFVLKNLAQNSKCNVLFVLGGSDASGFKPMVIMSQNLLPFEWTELLRFGWSLHTLKFILLRWTQSHSFRNADGIIFLTKYARDAVLNVTGPLVGKREIIPHGINSRFIFPSRQHRHLSEFQDDKPCRILYVSIVHPYKHQWHVVEAVAKLKSTGVPIVLKLVGPPASGMKRLSDTINRIDPEGKFITFCGAVPYEELNTYYASADIGVFASSCETMANILLEGMAASLPMACSFKGPMPAILRDAGTYFDPESSNSIAQALNLLIASSEIRVEKAEAGLKLSQQYSWQRCASKTFAFLAQISDV